MGVSTHPTWCQHARHGVSDNVGLKDKRVRWNVSGKARRPNAIYDKRWTNSTTLQLVHRLDPVFYEANQNSLVKWNRIFLKSICAI